MTSLLFDPIKEKALDLAVRPLRGAEGDFSVSDYTLDWYFEHQDDRITYRLPCGGLAIMTAQPDGRWKVSRYSDAVQTNHIFLMAVEFKDAEELFYTFMDGFCRLHRVSPKLLNQLMDLHEGKTFHLGFIPAVPGIVDSAIRAFKPIAASVAAIATTLVIVLTPFQAPQIYSPVDGKEHPVVHAVLPQRFRRWEE